MKIRLWSTATWVPAMIIMLTLILPSSVTADDTLSQSIPILYASAPLNDRGSATPPNFRENPSLPPRSAIGVVNRIQCKETCSITLSVSETGKSLLLLYIPDSGRDLDLFKKKYSGTKVRVTWQVEKRQPAMQKRAR